MLGRVWLADVSGKTMVDVKDPSSGLKTALSRFNSALDSLEVSVNGHLENRRSIDAAEDEVQSVNQDRAELAENLDKSEARAARLESLNKEVSHRLVTAMETIRSVVDGKPSEQQKE